MLDRILWKLLSRQTRDALLGRMRISDRQAMEKILSGSNRIPAAFRAKNCLFIHVPKAAGSSLQHALFGNRISGHLPLWHYESLHSAFVDHAYKFSFVRHPVDRAHSAYRYLRKAATFSRDAGFADVLNRYPSFDAFVRHWMHEDNVWLQIHFCPQWSFLCDRYGDLRMDFVGRYEQLDADFAHVCEQLAVDKALAHRNASMPAGRAGLSLATRQRLERIYARDFELFGYS